MNAYSEDLRKKIIEALQRGMTKSEVARKAAKAHWARERREKE